MNDLKEDILTLIKTKEPHKLQTFQFEHFKESYIKMTKQFIQIGGEYTKEEQQQSECITTILCMVYDYYKTKNPLTWKDTLRDILRREKRARYAKNKRYSVLYLIKLSRNVMRVGRPLKLTLISDLLTLVQEEIYTKEDKKQLKKELANLLSMALKKISTFEWRYSPLCQSIYTFVMPYTPSLMDEPTFISIIVHLLSIQDERVKNLQVYSLENLHTYVSTLNVFDDHINTLGESLYLDILPSIYVRFYDDLSIRSSCLTIVDCISELPLTEVLSQVKHRFQRLTKLCEYVSLQLPFFFHLIQEEEETNHSSIFKDFSKENEQFTFFCSLPPAIRYALHHHFKNT
mmetsp:Transcript_13488/g.20443  ORF Transcript_13488/g.20443 Transcript_13488/m.20443 type:complete len:345 (+) Transcript_13488:130-1164(+)